MKNIRYDFLTQSNIVFAKKREHRPNNFQEIPNKPLKVYREDCPFCVGNEDKSTEKIVEFQNDFGIKIIGNKYPVVSIEEEDNYGHHYVIVEDKRHNGDASVASKERFFGILKAYKLAINNIKKDKRIKYIQIFKNCKREGGASLEHPHSQIIALDHLPNKYLELLSDSCNLCNEINKEAKENIRIISKNKNFVAYAPYASINSYEIRIASLEHVGALEGMDDETLMSLSEIYVDIKGRLNKVLGDFPYNLAFYSLDKENFHFFLDIYPRKISLGGFEMSSGMIINSKLPEEVAKELKNL